MSIRQYVISDHPIIKYSQKIEDTKGIPTVVWQQQMEKAYIRTLKKYIMIAQTDFTKLTILKTLRLNSVPYH